MRLRVPFRLFLAIAVFLFALPSPASLNDRDTLAAETHGLPGVAQIVTGRFERSPPLYYQMRIARLKREIPLHPRSLDSYDDIAVAYDRLGNDDQALAWEQKKRARLLAMKVSDTDPATRENWYRYYANTGSFGLNRWIKRGADGSQIAQIRSARRCIERAVAINPDDHEGRDRYELIMIDWLVQPAFDGDATVDIETDHSLYAQLVNLHAVLIGNVAWSNVAKVAPDAFKSHDEHKLEAAIRVWIAQGLVDEPVAAFERMPEPGSRTDSVVNDESNEKYSEIGAYVHFRRWFGNGASDSDTADLDQALKLWYRSRYGANGHRDVTRADRDKVIRAARSQFPGSLSDAIHNYRLVYYAKPNDAERAISALLALDDAWESRDLIDALAYESYIHEIPPGDTLSDFAALRSEELSREGRTTLAESQGVPWFEPPVAKYTRSTYATLRNEADDWQAKRTAYMMTRLRAGRHPDTDPAFWNDWHDPGPPALEMRLSGIAYRLFGRSFDSEGATTKLSVVIGSLVVIAVLSGVVKRRNRRRFL